MIDRFRWERKRIVTFSKWKQGPTLMRADVEGLPGADNYVARDCHTTARRNFGRTGRGDT